MLKKRKKTKIEQKENEWNMEKEVKVQKNKKLKYGAKKTTVEGFVFDRKAK